ncbi:ATP-binding cassette sub-family C member 9 [Biomphalaria glabrata]
MESNSREYNTSEKLSSAKMGFCGSKSNAMSVKDGVIQNECFVDVLNIIPHALLALVSIFILTVWNHSVIGKLKVKTWVHYQCHNLRWICTLSLLATIIVEIAEGFISDLNDPDSTNYHAFVPACVAFLGALLSIIFYHNVEQWNSPRFLLLLLIYWPMAIVLKFLKALSIFRNDLTLDHLKVWLAIIDITFYMILFIIELNVLRCQRYAFFKNHRRMRPPSDLENTKYFQSYVNLLSQAVYWWVTDLLIQGFKHPLTLKDLGRLPQSEKSSRMYKKLQLIFEEEKYKATQKKKKPSLMLSVLRGSWQMLFLSGLFRLVGDCLAFVGPLLIERIVDYAYDVDDHRAAMASANYTRPVKVYPFVTVGQFFSNGYVLSVVLLLASVLQHTLLQNHHFIVIREGIRIRTAVQTMVYSKALKLSTLELNGGSTTVGQVMNHMSIDSTFLMFFFFFVHYVWAIPLQVALSLLIMYYKLGLAALIGGLFVIAAGPVMYFLGVAMSNIQKKIMVHSDKRVKKINEVIQGIKVIKLLSWEKGFIDSIQRTRKEELSSLFANNVYKALMGFVGICAPVIGTLLTFVLYPVLEEKPLTAGKTMAVLALFNLLQGPLQHLIPFNTTSFSKPHPIQHLKPHPNQHHIPFNTTSFSKPHPFQHHILFKATSLSTPHPFQSHIPFITTSYSKPHPIQHHILFKATSLSMPHPIQSHIPFNTTSHSTPYPFQSHIPFNTTSHSTPHPIQHHIPFNTTSHSTPHPIQHHILFKATSHSTPHPIQHHIPFNTTSYSKPHPFQCHIPFNTTSFSKPHPIQHHIPFKATSFSKPHPIQHHILFKATSHSTPHPIQHHIPFNTISYSTPYPIQSHIPFNTTSFSKPHPIQHHILFKATSHSTPHPFQSHILFKATSHSTPHPMHFVHYIINVLVVVANALVSARRLLPYLTASEVTKPQSSLPSFSKSCSVGLDSSAPSGHATIEKLDSVLSADGKSQSHHGTFELLPLDKDHRSSRISLNSSASVKVNTPSHTANDGRVDQKLTAHTGVPLSSSGGSMKASFLEPKRTNLSRNATSSELLDVKPNPALIRKSSAPALAVSEITGDYKRRRHHSQRSVEDDENAIEDGSIMDLFNTVEVQGGNFSWDLKKQEVSLKDITVKIPTGKLTMIVGPVGSGKSSLLSAFLGEMAQISGTMFKPRNISIAYVSQRPWLLNASLKENITFGKPFVWRKYKKVISSCALSSDIDQLPAADNTEIGEKGVNLSGGQKQRVTIARALYAEADAIFLDDPFSALDSYVGRHVMEEAVLKRLVKRNKTVVMVTHHIQYLTYAHQVIVMSNGHIHYQGKVGEVKKFDPDLYEVWRKAIKDAKAVEINQKFEGGDYLHLERKHSGGSQVSHDTMPRPSSSQSQLSVPGMTAGFPVTRKMSAMSVMTEASNEDAGDLSPHDDDVDEGAAQVKGATDQSEEKGKLIKQEFRETGAVNMWVYLRYLRSCSVTLCILSLLLQLIYHSLIVASNFWLSVWSSDSNFFARNATAHARNNTVDVEFDNTPYLMTFIYLSVGSVLATLVGCLIIYQTGYVASKNLFTNMLVTAMHFPIRFFDTNPSGRIINRFSGDVVAIDQRLGGHIENLLRCTFFTMSAIIVNAVTSPYFLFAAVPFFILYYCLQRFFRSTARELQRLDSITKSPIFSHFSETLNGLAVIRAFGVQTDFKRRAFKSIDVNVTPFLFIHTANRWLGIRLDYMSCLMVFISTVASLSSGLHGMSNPAFIGLCITYALMVSGQLNWIVRISTEVEMSMNAVERVLEYTDMEVEKLVTAEAAISVPESWPSVGRVEFIDVTLSYALDQDPVLHKASFVIEGGQKIGICGRTGSGKSSTILALFRMLEIIEGTILIDSLDIKRVDLATLRARLAIIPQDPVLFTGTIRFNLDPNNVKSDEKLWSVLETVQMKEAVTALPEQLDAQVTEGGDNLSVGQRQLICMARAFLRDAKIIIMDEATASIDQETDSKIQSILHSASQQHKTIITIAHRISTIMNYDKVLVLEYGEVKEFGPPTELASNELSVFHSLLHGTQDSNIK